MWHYLKAPAQNAASAAPALCCVCYSSAALSLFLTHDSHKIVYVRMRTQASISRVVLGVGLVDFWDIFLATYSFHEEVSMRGEHGREGAGCDDNTSALAGHLRGRRSSAGCGGRRCCSNVLRKLPSFVWDHPTQLQLREFTYTKTASKSHIHEKCTRILLRMADHPSVSEFPRRSGNTSI